MAKGYWLNHVAAFVCWIVLAVTIGTMLLMIVFWLMMATSGPILVYEPNPVILWSELAAQVIIIGCALYIMFNLVKGGNK